LDHLAGYSSYPYKGIKKKQYYNTRGEILTYKYVFEVTIGQLQTLKVDYWLPPTLKKLTMG